MNKVTFRLPFEIINALDQYCLQTKQNRSQVVRSVLKRFLPEQNVGQETQQQPVGQTVNGQVSGGQRPLSNPVRQQQTDEEKLKAHWAQESLIDVQRQGKHSQQYVLTLKR